MLALVDQLTVDLGADRHLDQLVLDVSYDPGPRAEFDPLRRFDVALHGAVQPHVRRRDDPFDAAALADRQHGPVLVDGHDVAADVPVDVQTALELDVALDARARADQRAGGRAPALLSSEHRRSLPDGRRVRPPSRTYASWARRAARSAAPRSRSRPARNRPATRALARAPGSSGNRTRAPSVRRRRAA